MSSRLRAWFRAAPVAVAPSEADASDGDLVRRFAAFHDDDAFAELLRRHGPMVLATCRRILHPDVHTADDAFQATFLVLATKAAAVHPPERVGAWLHGVAVHVAKKARAWARKLVSSAPADLDRVPVMPLEADPDAAELRAKIDDVLAGLPSKYRSAVILCDLEGRSRAEAANILGWSEGTLSGRLARARKLLADRLSRRGVVLPALVGSGAGVLLPASAALATVPGQLAASTFHSATLVAAGATAGEAIPASVAALAQGVPMHTTTFKLLTAGIAGLGLALGAFGLYAITAADPPTPPPQEKPLVVKAAAPAPVEKGWLAKHTFTSKNVVTAVAFGPDLVAVGDDEGVLILWDAKTGEEKKTVSVGKWKFKPIHRVQFLPDRTLRLVTGWTEEAKSLYYLDFPPPCDPEKMQATHSDTPFGATADGAFSFGYDNDKRDLTLWPIDPDAGKKGGVTLQARFRHESVVEYAAGDDANTVATITNGWSNPVLRFWSKGKDGPLRGADEGKEKPLWGVDLWKKIANIDVTGVFVAPGGKRLAVTGDAGQVWVFDAKTGKLLSKTDKLTGAVWSAAFSPDGKQIVAGCNDGTARVYNTETGEELAMLKGHKEAVIAVAFSPDGKMIATGGSDKTVRVWEFKK